MTDELKIISHLDLKVLSVDDIHGINKTTLKEHSSFSSQINIDDPSSDNDVKTIIIVEPKVVKNEKKFDKIEKKTKRIVSKTDDWKKIDTNDLEIDSQYKFIEDTNAITDIVSREIRKKISSYKSQDRRKNIYNDDKFIDFDFVIKLFKETQLKCYYCAKSVFVIYDNVRESKQWTIERIDNRLGHNKCNSVMSCLDCNLRRRTMYHERYIMTKKILSVKLVKLSD